MVGVFVIALLVLLLKGVGQRNGNVSLSAPGTKLRVVATFFPLYDFTRQVGKDKINLAVLFTQTPEVAAFTPSDIQKINSADLVIKNGLEFEVVLEDLIAASDNRDVAIVDASTNAEFLTSEDEYGGLRDPHIWLDPHNAMREVQTIADALSAYDPANAGFYHENAERYLAELRALDAEIKTDVAGYRSKDFVSFHSAFRYFANRYGLNQAAVIEPFIGKEPSPTYIAGVIETIKSKKISAIFSEPQFSPKVVQVIARDLGLTIRALDPLETGDIVQDSYISIMRKNLAVLREALQ